MSNDQNYIVEKVGVFTPKPTDISELNSGEIGFIITGIKSLSEGGFSLAKIEYEEGPPDISLVNDANGRKSKLEPEMLKTRDMDYIKNVMRALKKLN